MAMVRDMVEKRRPIVRADGGEVIRPPGDPQVEDLVLTMHHWVGSPCGNGPQPSVVDTTGRAHDRART